MNIANEELLVQPGICGPEFARGQFENKSIFQKAYSILITLLLGMIVFMTISQANQKNKFEEIDVERINIVEKDGKVKNGHFQ